MSAAEVDALREQARACDAAARRAFADGDLPTFRVMTDARMTLVRLADEAINAWAA